MSLILAVLFNASFATLVSKSCENASFLKISRDPSLSVENKICNHSTSKKWNTQCAQFSLFATISDDCYLVFFLKCLLNILRQAL